MLRWWDRYERPETAAGTEAVYRLHAAELLGHATPGSRLESLEFARQAACSAAWKMDGLTVGPMPWKAIDAINRYCLQDLERVNGAKRIGRAESSGI